VALAEADPGVETEGQAAAAVGAAVAGVVRQPVAPEPGWAGLDPVVGLAGLPGGGSAGSPQKLAETSRRERRERGWTLSR